MTAIRVGIEIQQQHATLSQIQRAWQTVDTTSADTLFNPVSGSGALPRPRRCGAL